ncbi:hypothetical protein Ancab_033960 [Ancistrocladus abbreviatus]
MDHGSSDGAVQVNERLNLGDLGHQGHGENSGNFGNGTVPEQTVVSRPENSSNLDNLTEQGLDESLGNSGDRHPPEAVIIVIRSGNAVDLSDQGNYTENSTNPGEQGVLRNVIVTRSENLAIVSADAEAYAFESRNGSMEEQKMNFAKGEDDKHSYITNSKRGDGDNWECEKLCRICHLGSDQACETASGTEISLILLGCACKGELCVAHRHCAEAWFKLKGNRVCEICGETAKNVTGSGDNRFIEEWNARGSTGNETSASERFRCGWSGQPFCNFLMACLVIAFILPWFFRVNMF